MSDRPAPLVSIVLIFLDAAPFLEEAIASVRAQRHPNWELLLVDDGSTDGSTAIAERHAAADGGRIRHLAHPGRRNRGKSISRNLGIGAARGEYVAFLDADDVLLPEKLAHQVAILEQRPEAGMVFGRTQYWYSWDGGTVRRDFVSRLGAAPGTTFRPPALVTRFLRDPGAVPCLCSALVRRRIAEQVGGFAEAIQDLYEDQTFLMKVCVHAAVVADGACGERYRQHAGSTSSLAIASGAYHPWKPNAARRRFLDWLGDHLATSGVDDAAMRRALDAELWPYRHPLWGGVVSLVRYGVRRATALAERGDAAAAVEGGRR